MTQLIEQFYAVEVPDYATDFTVDMEEEESMLYYFNGDNIDSTVEVLPEGNWQFLFTTYEMNIDDAMYIYKNTGMKLPELLRSKGLDDQKNYAILKKEP